MKTDPNSPAMPKLELRHLAPYLPYGLKIKILNHKCDYVGIEYSEANGFYLIGDSLHVTYNGSATGKDIKSFKPILCPMSDLGKLNIIEGNRITPIVEIFNVRFAYGAYDIIEITRDNDKCTLKVAWDKVRSSISKFSFVANDNSFVLYDGSKQQRVGHQLEMFQKLFEYHFDVFSLISDGLAIDINTIKS